MNFKGTLRILCGVFIALLGFALDAYAVGVASGTTVSNRATVNWTTNGAAAETTTISTALNDTTVSRIGGDTLADPGNQTMGVGDTKIFTYTFTNKGNASDTFQIVADAFTLTGGAASWTFTLYVNGAQTSTLNDTKTSLALAADAYGSCSVAVWANSTPANSPDGSRADVRLRITSGNDSLAAQYTGDNNTVYTSAQKSDTSWATVAAANLTLAKVITSVTIAGTASMPKPGATILYTLTYNNTGSAAADSVIVRDTIPTNTSWDSASRAGGSSLGASATLVDNDTGATGWCLQVATIAQPSQIFYSADYTPIASFVGAPSTVTWVRWIRTTVAASQTATLRFRTIIQ